MTRKKMKQDGPLIKNGDEVTVAPEGFLGARFGGKVIAISDDGTKATIQLSEESPEQSTGGSAVVDIHDIDTINSRPVYDALLKMNTPKVAPVPGLDGAVLFANEIRSEGQSESRVAWEALGRLAFSAKMAQQSMLRSHVQIIETSKGALKQADAMDELFELSRSMMYSAASNASARLSMSTKVATSVGDVEMSQEQEVLLRLSLLTMPVSDLKQMLNKSGLTMLAQAARRER